MHNIQKNLDISKYQSKYDPARETVGKVYRDLQLYSNNVPILAGDMTNEMLKGYVEDLEEAFRANPFNDEPYYVLVVEKKDLQMKSAVIRRIFSKQKRPWPEDGTDCYWIDPKTNERRFCWCIPHWSEMDNILRHAHQYSRDLIRDIVAWKNFAMKCFGFYYDPEHKWQPDPTWKDRPFDYHRKKIS